MKYIHTKKVFSVVCEAPTFQNAEEKDSKEIDIQMVLNEKNDSKHSENWMLPRRSRITTCIEQTSILCKWGCPSPECTYHALYEV